MNDIHHAGVKFTGAITVAVALDWLTTAGKIAGALYAIAVLGEWVWKRWIKPWRGRV